jgi:hypothetical protein
MNEGDSPPPTDRTGNTGNDDQQYRTDDTVTREETREVPRKNALSTLAQSLRWLVGLPVLLAAFLLTRLLGSLSSFLDPLFGLVFLPLNIVLSFGLWGLAYVYADRQIREAEGTFRDAVRAVLDRIGPLIVLAVFYGVLVLLGLVALVLPGIYVATRLALAFPACVLDNQGVSESLSTGWETADGNLAKIFGILLVASVLTLPIVVAGATGNLDIVNSAAFELATVPVSAVLGAVSQLAIGRVYLENR